jgi:hypothetical protein
MTAILCSGVAVWLWYFVVACVTVWLCDCVASVTVRLCDCVASVTVWLCDCVASVTVWLCDCAASVWLLLWDWWNHSGIENNWLLDKVTRVGWMIRKVAVLTIRRSILWQTATCFYFMTNGNVLLFYDKRQCASILWQTATCFYFITNGNTLLFYDKRQRASILWQTATCFYFMTNANVSAAHKYLTRSRLWLIH